MFLKGSIFGALEIAVLERAVTREVFAESGRLPDWLSPDPTLREEKRPIKKGSSTPILPRHSATTKTKPSI